MGEKNWPRAIGIVNSALPPQRHSPVVYQVFGPVLSAKLGRLPTFAAALAFGFVLSVVPFLVLTFTLGSWLANWIDPRLDLGRAYIDLLHQLPENDGVSAAVQVIAAVQKSAHRGLLTLGLVLSALASFNLMTQMVRTLLFIFDTQKRAEEWNSRAGWKALALLAIWVVILLLISATTIFTPIGAQILQQGGITSHLARRLVAWFMDGAILAALPLAFLVTFWVVAPKPYPLPLLLKGSLIASAGIVGFTLLFAYALGSIWLANPLYGALGSVLAVLVWAQSCAWSVIAGAGWIVRFARRPRGKK